MRRRPLKDSSARRALVTLTVVFALASAAGSHAGPTPEQACQSGKNKTAGKYAACRENAEAKLAASGDTTKYGEAITKCADKLAAAWQKLEDKAVGAGTTCPSVGDATLIDGKIAATTDTVAALVGGVRFEDNGDGTVTDHQTGLQWEQKVSPGGGATDPHDVDNLYSWNVSGAPYPPTGTAFSDFLYKLNDCTSSDGTAATTAGFAGHCDWRLPTIQELKTIIDLDACGGGNPCIDPIFGPSAANLYWSATTSASDPAYAWFVHFLDGSVTFGGKVGSVHVRAVRTGS